MEDTLQPWDGYLVSPALEMLGVTTYLNMAQSFERVGEAMERGEGLSPGEVDTVLHALCMGLTYLDACGVTARHPALAAMPKDIPPSEFQGGDEEGIVQWLAQELADCVANEKDKLLCLFN